MEDLLAEKVEYVTVTATFKGTQVINGQSSEVAGPGVLQFVFQHRFGSLSDDFFYNFLDSDNADVRLSIDYSFNDWLNIGLGRSSFEKTYDASTKSFASFGKALVQKCSPEHDRGGVCIHQ